jgi:hypothetical protein
MEQKDATVGEMRKRLEELTDVQSKRQKIIGLGKKPNPSDELILQDLSLKNPHSFMMVSVLVHTQIPHPAMWGFDSSRFLCPFSLFV